MAKTGNGHFLGKVEIFVRHTPFLHTYHWMAREFWALDRKDENLEIVQRARYLFPESKEDWLTHTIEKPAIQELKRP